MQSSIASDQKLDRGQGIRLIGVCTSFVLAIKVYTTRNKSLPKPLFTLQKHSMKQTQVSPSELLPSCCTYYIVQHSAREEPGYERASQTIHSVSPTFLSRASLSFDLDGSVILVVMEISSLGGCSANLLCLKVRCDRSVCQSMEETADDTAHITLITGPHTALTSSPFFLFLPTIASISFPFNTFSRQ